uniref:Candidate secreted effector n=1 Tax=Meloidogyne incognita TaxID=6306 RepID=A0A914KIG7_MELIC
MSPSCCFVVTLLDSPGIVIFFVVFVITPAARRAPIISRQSFRQWLTTNWMVGKN